jgi:hypothetical protein
MRRDRKLHGDKGAGLKEKWDIVYGSGCFIMALGEEKYIARITGLQF